MFFVEEKIADKPGKIIKLNQKISLKTTENNGFLVEGTN